MVSADIGEQLSVSWLPTQRMSCSGLEGGRVEGKASHGPDGGHLVALIYTTV